MKESVNIVVATDDLRPILQLFSEWKKSQGEKIFMEPIRSLGVYVGTPLNGRFEGERLGWVPREFLRILVEKGIEFIEEV